jgi:hypothetical protein
VNIIQSDTGKYVTTCRLCLAKVAESPALEIPIVGHPGKKIEQLMQVLVKHLTKHHPDEFQRGTKIYQEFLPWIILHAFDYEDASIGPRLENIRAGLFQEVRKNSFTDQSLSTITASIGLDPDDAAKVLKALQLVRDACCETGTYAPAIQHTPLVV